MHAGYGALLVLDLLRSGALTPYATQLMQWLRALLPSMQQGIFGPHPFPA